MTMTASNIWKRTDYDENTGCWNYRGLADSVLKPIMPRDDWKKILWEGCKGPVPEGFTVWSSCGNGVCANPHHLVCTDVNAEDGD